MKQEGEEIVSRAITDENGNITGYEECRPIRNDKGEIIDYQKIDREAERAEREEKQRQEEEEERKRQEEEAKTSIGVQIDYEGITEEDIQAEKEYQEERRQELRKISEEISQIPDEKKQAEELAKFVEENPDLFATETYTMETIRACTIHRRNRCHS